MHVCKHPGSGFGSGSFRSVLGLGALLGSPWVGSPATSVLYSSLVGRERLFGSDRTFGKEALVTCLS